jgi:predicted Ser/Thr protein kinase
MRTMLSLVSRINQAGLKMPGKEKCVNSLQVLGLLRGFMATKAKATNNTPEQQAVYDRVLKWLGGAPVPGEEPKEKPDIIEAEYRRMLRALLLQVFAPDYDVRAQKLFADYRLHAPVAFEGKPTVKDPLMGQVPVNTGLVDELDRYRLDKVKVEKDAKEAPLSTEDKSFRGKLDALIGILRDDYVGEHGAEAAKDFKVTWETIPELGKAIRGKLDSEIGRLMEKLITTEVKSDLNVFEQEQLTRAESALTEAGFCPACVKPVLEYAKRTKVWSFKLS